MSVEDLKKELASLSQSEQSEVTAFLFHLRHTNDPHFQDAVSHRLADPDRTHWLTPAEFEEQLDKR